MIESDLAFLTFSNNVMLNLIDAFGDFWQVLQKDLCSFFCLKHYFSSIYYLEFGIILVSTSARDPQGALEMTGTALKNTSTSSFDLPSLSGPTK